MSPRKVRLVVDVVRGLSVDEALAQLRFSSKAAARPVRKLIESAVANAVHNDHLQREALYIAQIVVDQGPTYKRSQPRAFGRAGMIRKRTSHVSVTVAPREGAVAKTTAKKALADAPTTKKSAVKQRASSAKTPTAKRAGAAKKPATKPRTTATKPRAPRAKKSSPTNKQA